MNDFQFESFLFNLSLTDDESPVDIDRHLLHMLNTLQIIVPNEIMIQTLKYYGTIYLTNHFYIFIFNCRSN